jgi:hypothetical protein
MLGFIAASRDWHRGGWLIVGTDPGRITMILAMVTYNGDLVVGEEEVLRRKLLLVLATITHAVVVQRVIQWDADVGVVPERWRSRLVFVFRLHPVAAIACRHFEPFAIWLTVDLEPRVLERLDSSIFAIEPQPFGVRRYVHSDDHYVGFEPHGRSDSRRKLFRLAGCGTTLPICAMEVLNLELARLGARCQEGPCTHNIEGSFVLVVLLEVRVASGVALAEAFRVVRRSIAAAPPCFVEATSGRGRWRGLRSFRGFGRICACAAVAQPPLVSIAAAARAGVALVRPLLGVRHIIAEGLSVVGKIDERAFLQIFAVGGRYDSHLALDVRIQALEGCQ